MVLVQSAPKSLLSHVHPNPARVFGVAGAIALNIALLMALLVPMQSPPPLAPREEPIAWQWFDPVKKPDPPPVVAVVPPKPVPPQPAPQTRAVQPTVDPPPVVVDQGGPVDLPFVPPTQDQGTTATADIAPNPGPVAGVRLEYASAPPPTYPRRALLDRAEGQVLLQVLVDVDGKPLDVSIHKSSGNRELDRTAQQHILRNWTFRPAMKDGRAIQAIGLVPIDFTLQ